MLQILVLTHDLSDAATARRVAMLRAGGAAVRVAGFRRTDAVIDAVAGCPASDFGRTYGGGFAQRIWSVLREVALLKKHQALFVEADIILARNLENLAIAVRGRALAASKPVIIYEVLDIHRLLLKSGAVGKILRALEGWLCRHAALLITSSPAFVANYFEKMSAVRLPALLIENKLFTATPPAPLPPRAPGPPWIIGWFGMIRCRKSLAILSDLARRSDGAIEVVIRGRPAPDQFPDFENQIAAMPGVKFLGAYKNPDDLAALYREAHFTWAIDMFEEGLNSAWLLPNRIYEGGAYGAVPLADERVETGRFLQRLECGVTLRSPLEKSLAGFFAALTPARYTEYERAVAAVAPATWLCATEDCTALVEKLKGLRNHG